MKKITLCFGLLVCMSVALSQRQTLPINSDWFYLENGQVSLDQLPDLNQWQPIQLPHTWNQWDAVDNLPGYRRDASWYQRELYIDEPGTHRYLLYFEGANIKTQVYVNGQLAGKHIGGYVGFDVDINEQVVQGENTILVRVDNGYDPQIIPSQKADFFIFGGITRDVWLKKLPLNHLSAARISTPEVSTKKATAQLAVQLHGNSSSKNRSLRAYLQEPTTGKKVLEKEISLGNEQPGQVVTFDLGTLSKPHLWSPDDPYLYECVVEYLEDGQAIDQLTEKVGFRWFHFEEHGAFFLNGKRLLLRGTHRHEEHAGFGAAMSNAQHRKDMVQIKEMGANFVRLGHYPQDPEIYKACNELGIIVWDELPWCRGGIGDETWKANSRRLFKEQILQNYNHPSICFWSLGNEVYWMPDFPGGGDTASINPFVRELNDLAHEIDPTRMTALRKYYPGAHMVDAFSPSIWSGWYAGVYTSYQQALEREQKKYPQFLHMEYGGSSHVGRHTETPITGSGMLDESKWAEVSNQVAVRNIAKEGDWTENYIVDLFDWHLSVSESLPGFAGNAQWAFKDFGTPLRPENAIPYLNQKGLFDRAGNPKDAYFVYKSYWSNEPFTYIESHTWTERSGPQDKSRALCVYSNCEEVELFHKGKSLGRKKRNYGKFPAHGLTWDVSFEEGENELIAQGFNANKRIAGDTLRVSYTFEQHGSPNQVQLSSKPLPNGNVLVEAKMIDKNGNRVLDYEKRMYFSADGSSDLLINYGTPTRSQVIEMANGRAAIELDPAPGKTVIEARNQDFKGSYLTLNFSEEETKKVQALLLRQPEAFDLSHKNKINGPYQAVQKIEVPKDLSPQNKWAMFEGPVLENDLIAYRFYMDSRHRFDIYGKRVANLVMDTVSWNYHDVMDWGSDILKVGNSLGIGSPAIWYQDSVYTLSQYEQKTVEITEQTDDYANIRTTFQGLRIGSHRFDLIQDWSLQAGEAWCELSLEVVNGNLPQGMYFATGIVKHLEECETQNHGGQFAAYTWGEQSFHHENLGMAVVIPQYFQPEKVKDVDSHTFVLKHASHKAHYRFLAAWERDLTGVHDLESFIDLVRKACMD
ncbi:MAG: DUF4861 family protein [Bacteroidia bacterium]